MEQSSITTLHTPPFLTLPVEIGTMILSYVDQKTLALFEMVSKTVEPYAHAAWHQRKSLSGLKFNWLSCQTEKCPKKWELLVTQTLINYMNCHTVPKVLFRESFLNHPEHINKIYLQSEKIIQRYPILGAYIRLNLAEYIYNYSRQGINKELPLETLPSSFRPYFTSYCSARQWLHTFKVPYFRKALESRSKLGEDHSLVIKDLDQTEELCRTTSEWNGEQLLRAILKIDNIPIPRDAEGGVEMEDLQEMIEKEDLQKAIDQGATCVSRLALNLLIKSNTYAEDFDEVAEWIEPLVISAAQQGDESSLEALLKEESAYSKTLYDKGSNYHFFPVLHALSQWEWASENWNEADSLYSQMISLQKNNGLNPDSHMLLKAAYMKVNAEKWKEAESLYEALLINMRNQSVKAGDLMQVLYHLAIINIGLENWEKAESFFTESSLLFLKMIDESIRTTHDIDCICLPFQEMTKEPAVEPFHKIVEELDDKIIKHELWGRSINGIIYFFYENFLFEGLSIKVKLEKWEEAYPLYQALMSEYKREEIAYDEMPESVKTLVDSIKNKMDSIEEESYQPKSKRARHH